MKKSRWVLGVLSLVLIVALLAFMGGCGEEEAATSTEPGSTESTGPAGSAGTEASVTETTAAEEPAETLKIGVVLQLTDWYSVVDAGEKTDIEIVAKMLNDEGGLTVQGKKYNIELVIEDGKSSLDGNTAAANKLVLDEGVKFVCGPAAFFNMATSPIFEQAKVLHVASYNACMPEEMGPNTPYEFLGMDPVAQQSANLKALLQLYPDVKKLAWATAEESSTPYIVPELQKLVDRMGLELTNRDPILFSPSLEDFNPICAQLNAMECDAIWFPIGTPPNYGAMVKGVRTLGNMTPFVFSQWAPNTINIAGPEASTHIVNPLSFQYKAPGNPEILDKIFALGDPNRQWFGMAPNGLYMLKHAIESADSLDPTEVRDHWETLDTIPTVYGDGFPSGNELYGLTNHAWAYPVSVAHIMDGEIEYIGWVTPDPTP